MGKAIGVICLGEDILMSLGRNDEELALEVEFKRVDSF